MMISFSDFSRVFDVKNKYVELVEPWKNTISNIDWNIETEDLCLRDAELWTQYRVDFKLIPSFVQDEISKVCNEYLGLYEELQSSKNN